MSEGKLLVLSGPSGVGKGTIVGEVLKLRPETSLSISCTTREKRRGETEGVSYFFVTHDEFKKKIEEGGFLEWSEHLGNYYGTPKSFVEKKLKRGNVILEIDVNGALAVKKVMPRAVLVMIAPKDKEVLYERLRGRGTESAYEIEKRISRAEFELSKAPMYDYTVINDKLEEAVSDVIKILDKENG